MSLEVRPTPAPSAGFASLSVAQAAPTAMAIVDHAQQVALRRVDDVLTRARSRSILTTVNLGVTEAEAGLGLEYKHGMTIGQHITSDKAMAGQARVREGQLSGLQARLRQRVSTVGLVTGAVALGGAVVSGVGAAKAFRGGREVTGSLYAVAAAGNLATALAQFSGRFAKAGLVGAGLAAAAMVAAPIVAETTSR